MIIYSTFRALLLLALSFSTAAIVASQEASSPKRIQLKPGGPAVVLESKIGKNEQRVYVFSAKAGQKFSGRITKKDGNTGFAVTDPDNAPLPEEEYDFNTSLNGSLKKTGDYKITVTTLENRCSRFTLVVKIN